MFLIRFYARVLPAVFAAFSATVVAVAATGSEKGNPNPPVHGFDGSAALDAFELQGDNPATFSGDLLGKHPRLLFGEEDIPALKAFARSEEGNPMWDELMSYLGSSKKPAAPAFLHHHRERSTLEPCFL